MQKEKRLQKQIVRYLEFLNLELIVISDPNGIRLTIGQAVELKEMRLPKEGAHPDLWVFEPINGFHGLFIELKIEGTKVFKKNGDVYKKFKHQHEMHQRLRKKGYFGGFAIGFEEARKMIEQYFNYKK